jgi:putative CocE/NonD family hydrolase
MDSIVGHDTVSAPIPTPCFVSKGACLLHRLHSLGALLLFALAMNSLLAQAPPQQANKTAPEWVVTAAEIPMRDGVKLHTLIATPQHAGPPMPFMLERTPYGAPDNFLKSVPAGAAMAFSKDGYIRVWQDIRGRFKSEGDFVMLRPPHNPQEVKGIDESTDTYDTIDWLLKNVPGNNGRAGIQGVSYDGWLAAMALIHPHPALKAASPQAPVADMFLGDDFHHNGAFRLSYGFEYVWMLESGKELNGQWPIDLPDAYDWYLRLGPLSNANANYLHGTRPSWNDFVAHPNYDAFWQRQAIAGYLMKSPLTVPTLLVGGWYDQEDFYGPQRIYAELERHDPHHLAYLVLGPWNHGGWGGGPGQKLGPIDFGSPAGEFYREQILKPWFDHWLKETDKADFDKFAHVWTYETGAGQWVRGDRWPPRDVAPRSLYLGADRTASFEPPTAEEANGFDSYVSDPAHPAPYRQRPILPTYGDGSTWYTWLTDDQRALEARPDVLTWKTAPLTADMSIAGDVMADLYAATSGTDSDWVVKLLDIYPADYPDDPKLAGYELIISDEVFRGRFRTSYVHPQALPSDRVLEYHIDLHTADHLFRKGHRIGVQIQSAWFPLIDRNPQRFVPNIFTAKADDYQVATQRIYRSRRHPTHIVLPANRSRPAEQRSQ